ncbi:MAG: tryptophan-rich sensory protein [Clostridia bacterium]|nr:tryptophan-rich sensory protein [Clostridia bacterium]
MNFKIKPFLIAVGIPLAVGGLSALLSRRGTEMYETIAKPPLSPPGWLFPVVWTILFILMGIASYLVYNSGEDEVKVRNALTVYGVQLAVNFFWSLIFFNMQNYLFAFIWLILLWVLIVATIILFFRISEVAGYLLVPYLLWVSFAGYLSYSVYILNR